MIIVEVNTGWGLERLGCTEENLKYTLAVLKANDYTYKIKKEK